MMDAQENLARSLYETHCERTGLVADWAALDSFLRGVWELRAERQNIPAQELSK